MTFEVLDYSVPCVVLGEACWACRAACVNICKVHTSMLGYIMSPHTLLRGEGCVTQWAVFMLVLIQWPHLEADGGEGFLLVCVDGELVVLGSFPE